ncbi:MAG: tRNA (guanosine(37)-N1)-methyltransferase TrmD [Gammaproteobacteria bacterium]|nr:tRNA (guanosine(37)-N1)-methyltransferase TrmD [Gammaproteobacteria bacterium]
MHLGVISIMPELVEHIQHGIIKKAVEHNKVTIDCWNPRDWADKPACRVDDTPYGGGPGMVMCYQPLSAAIRFARSCMPSKTKVVYLSPQGRTIKQSDLNAVVEQQQSLLFVAGRYEGIDERVIETHIDEEWSLGDFVLSGGELAAMVFIDTIVRLIPGVLGHPESAIADSFMKGYLDTPHYTKPACIEGQDVPAVLLSGHRANIERWRTKQALGRTWLKRPDLLTNLTLSASENELLATFKREQGTNHEQHH